MSPDPRLPVIVGVGELVRRPGEPGVELTEPAAMMAEVLRLAADDAGTGDRLLRRAGALAAVPSASWLDGDPGRRVRELLGLDAVPTLRSSMLGGNGPQALVNMLAERIQGGQLDVALLCGAEALQSVVHAGKAGIDLGWPAPDGEATPGEVVEADRAPSTEAETAVGMIAPIMAYPLIENALRSAAGSGADAHLQQVAHLWSRFSQVAADNPYAWTPEAHTPEQLGTPSESNRRVTFPYLKLMNANIQVDQAAALILCSAEAAQSLGVPRDRWVFVHAGAQAVDEWHLSERRELHRSPAIAACGRAAFENAGCGPDDLAYVDLYSCFPAAVQLAAGELGLPLDDPARPLTCTGGLTFFGGPGNDYATHGIAAVARRLREGEAGERGLATALGWYATKHALGIYGNEPPPNGYRLAKPDVGPARREVAPPERTAATAETCTVIYERDGEPSYGILFAIRDDGRRALAKTDDRDTMEAMTADGFLGSRVELRADRSFGPLARS